MRAPRRPCRRDRARLALVASLALAATLTGCARAQDITGASSPPQRTATITPTIPTISIEPITPPVPTAVIPTSTAPAAAPRPRVGNCYDAGTSAFKNHRDGSRPVPCSATHNTETYSVWPASSFPDTATLDHIRRQCAARFIAYVGASPMVSTLETAFFTADAAQVESGQIWVRCDAIKVDTFQVKIGLPVTGSVKGVLAGKVPRQFRACTQHWPPGSADVHLSSCTQPHQGELIPESLTLGGPEAPYPGVSTVQTRSRSFCQDVFQNYTPQTTHYEYYYPTAASWETSTHTSACWSFVPEGEGLPGI